jgi:hypothetical protein
MRVARADARTLAAPAANPPGLSFALGFVVLYRVHRRGRIVLGENAPGRPPRRLGPNAYAAGCDDNDTCVRR